MSSIPIFADESWRLPSRGRVGMLSLIVGESGIFTIFVVAYIYYIGRSLSGPTAKILEVPIFNSVCLLSSSVTIILAEHAIQHGSVRRFAAWWALTMLLGIEFLAGTAIEWCKLIFEDHLTIRTNLFGTTYYSLVGLHATHVIIGLIGLSLVMLFTLTGRVKPSHAERIQVLALYWHFVDAVWVVVFTVVYIVGR
ncbi:MAG: heme-copper oxidase subunit III [Terracidiphilus sp.]|jgi:cytochrome c oxidase subunit III